jgi:hypothetical protein
MNANYLLTRGLLRKKLVNKWRKDNLIERDRLKFFKCGHFDVRFVVFLPLYISSEIVQVERLSTY